MGVLCPQARDKIPKSRTYKIPIERLGRRIPSRRLSWGTESRIDTTMDIQVYVLLSYNRGPGIESRWG